jgi:hypothetical protein
MRAFGNRGWEGQLSQDSWAASVGLSARCNQGGHQQDSDEHTYDQAQKELEHPYQSRSGPTGCGRTTMWSEMKTLSCRSGAQLSATGRSISWRMAWTLVVMTPTRERISFNRRSAFAPSRVEA